MKNNFKDGYVKILKGKLYYKILGKGNLIIFLHGGPGPGHSYFLPQMEKLAHNNQIVFYD